ncbi:hypothetical protein PORY_000495 [Pneumocystis oryctolagi]|uniref:Uncharacterized protein n=1 Tax=Pneumocystis oryctolagi TaxID=42067 RepID=A0ACB7CHR9_9ASCO|nr:hypothetical protein PORY_000495 [Pneumocystis oryctolagi]
MNRLFFTYQKFGFFSGKKCLFLRYNSTIQKPASSSQADLLLRILYESPVQPPIEFSEEELERHEVIHRAWQICERAKREELNKQLERQYNKMKRACEELERIDKKLFRAAMSKKKYYFPVEMRTPTDTPPLQIWKHDWTRPSEKTDT